MMKLSILLVMATIWLTFSVNIVAQEDSGKINEKIYALKTINDSLSFLPAGAVIHKRTENKIYCFLPQDTKIQGLLCRGDENNGWETAFYTNGNLAVAWLAQPAEIGGVPCASANFWTELLGGSAVVYFHENGKLARCKLSRDANIQGHNFEKGDIVRFDTDGIVILSK